MTQATDVEGGPVVTDWKQIGERLIECLAALDFNGLGENFHPRVRCRLLLPAGLFTPIGAPEIVTKFRQWFGEAEQFDVEQSQISQIGDRLHIGYTIRIREKGDWYKVEQQTYSRLEDGSIASFDLLCSGFRLDRTVADEN